MFIKSHRIYTENGPWDGFIEIKDGIIANLYKADAPISSYVDYGSDRIIAGIFDTHNHGTMGYSMIDLGQDQPAVIKGYLKGLAGQGVTSVLATASISMFEALAAAVGQKNDGAELIGIHSEGPYLNRVGEKGVDTGHPEITLDDVKAMTAKAGGKLKLVAIAPELANASQAVAYWLSQGVRVAFAHSNCDYQQAMEAFGWGITISTHTCNVMSGIHHRHMGGLGACLLNPDVNNEIICDFMHVSQEMLELMFKCKPLSKFVMVSDNILLAGAPQGVYKADIDGTNMELHITPEGFCLTDTGRLMGSTKPVLYGIGNLVEKMGLPLEQVSQMASLNPARLYGVGDHKGSIWYGKDADLAVISDDYQARYTYSKGRLVYDWQKDTALFNQDVLQYAKQ